MAEGPSKFQSKLSENRQRRDKKTLCLNLLLQTNLTKYIIEVKVNKKFKMITKQTRDLLSVVLSFS